MLSPGIICTVCFPNLTTLTEFSAERYNLDDPYYRILLTIVGPFGEKSQNRVRRIGSDTTNCSDEIGEDCMNVCSRNDVEVRSSLL